MVWKRDKNLIAERFRKDELPGFLSKQFEVKGDEFLVLEKNGEIYLERDHGTLSVSSFMGDFTDVIMIDKSEKTIENEVKNAFFAEGMNVGIKLAIKFRVFNSDHFSKNLLGQRKRLFLEDVWNELVSDVLCGKILPRLQKKPAKDFASEAFRDKTRTGMESELKKKFREWGLILSSLTLGFDIPKEAEAEDVRAEPESAADEQLKNEGKHLKAGMTVEEEAEELEKERLERDVAMALEKKQMQEDVEDAMEAMELKDILQKKKMLMGGGTGANEGGDLAEELENLRKAKEITERKFYKKELSEESFQRMMEEFERKIIEIETKLKKGEAQGR